MLPDGAVCHGEHHVRRVVGAVVGQGHQARGNLDAVDVQLQEVATEGDGIASPATAVEARAEGLGVWLASMSG